MTCNFFLSTQNFLNHKEKVLEIKFIAKICRNKVHTYIQVHKQDGELLIIIIIIFIDIIWWGMWYASCAKNILPFPFYVFMYPQLPPSSRFMWIWWATIVYECVCLRQVRNNNSTKYRILRLLIIISHLCNFRFYFQIKCYCLSEKCVLCAIWKWRNGF